MVGRCNWFGKHSRFSSVWCLVKVDFESMRNTTTLYKVQNQTFLVPYLLGRTAACWPAALVLSVRLCWCKLQPGLQRCKEKKRREEDWCVGTKPTIRCALLVWSLNIFVRTKQEHKHKQPCTTHLPDHSTTQIPHIDDKPH